MQQFNFDTIQEVLNPSKFIDTAEKNTHAVLAYIEPKELSKTLVNLTSAQATFARAQVEAFNSMKTVVEVITNEFKHNIEKATK